MHTSLSLVIHTSLSLVMHNLSLSFSIGSFRLTLLTLLISLKVVVFDPPEEEQNTKGVPNHSTRHRNVQLAFDVVLDQYASQRQVYESTCKPVLEPVMDGFNATVFAYGATGAGKTHTMVGTRETEGGAGVMVLALRDLFAMCKQREQEGKGKFQICFSYLEVYNETIRDLLVAGHEAKRLELREDRGACFVPGLTHHRPADAEALFRLLEEGNTRRAQSATGANATSSRSHAVLQILVEHQRLGLKTMNQTGKLSLVDLAGSERAAHTMNQGDRMREGAKINRSLLALANCINALTNPSVRYVPFRDSKLTRLLRDSLGGNCRTVMIAAVSPSSLRADDSYNTLRYASRAKTIRCRPRRNVQEVNSRVHEYKRIIGELQGQVKLLRRQMSRLACAAGQGGADGSAVSAILGGLPVLSALFDAQLKYRKALLQLQEQDHQRDLRELELNEQLGRTRDRGQVGGPLMRTESPRQLRKVRQELADIKGKQRAGLDKRRQLAVGMSSTAEKYKHLHQRLAAEGGLPAEHTAVSATVTAHAAQIEKLDLAILAKRQQHQLERRELTSRLKHAQVQQAEQAQRILLQRCVDLCREKGVRLPEGMSADIAAATAGEVRPPRTPSKVRLLRTPSAKTPARAQPGDRWKHSTPTQRVAMFSPGSSAAPVTATSFAPIGSPPPSSSSATAAAVHSSVAPHTPPTSTSNAALLSGSPSSCAASLSSAPTLASQASPLAMPTAPTLATTICAKAVPVKATTNGVCASANKKRTLTSIAALKSSQRSKENHKNAVNQKSEGVVRSTRRRPLSTRLAVARAPTSSRC
jgi:kinesin family member 18A